MNNQLEMHVGLRDSIIEQEKVRTGEGHWIGIHAQILSMVL